MAENGSYYDEVFDGGGAPRAHAAALAAALERARATTASSRRAAAATRSSSSLGITVRRRPGPDATGRSTTARFPFDLVPRVLPAADWRYQAGLQQRVPAMNRSSTTSTTTGRSSTTASSLALVVSGSIRQHRHGIHPPAGSTARSSGTTSSATQRPWRCSRTTRARRPASPT